MFKNLLILGLVPFILNAKIYKYPITETLPSCVESGGYFESEGIAIGFARDSGDNTSVPELTEAEYIEYVKILGLHKDGILMSASEKESWASATLTDKKRQYGEIVDVVPNPVGIFLGKIIRTKQDVSGAVNAKLSENIKSITGSGDSTSNKIQLINNVLVLVLAMQGTITYEQANIAGILNTASATAYIQGLYNSLWSKRNDYEQQAQNFITEFHLDSN